MEIDEEIMINHQSARALCRPSSATTPTVPVDITSFFTIDFFDASAGSGQVVIDDSSVIHEENEELLSLSETLVKKIEETMDQDPDPDPNQTNITITIVEETSDSA
jgi:hypothetical protein